jgi:hypothetical protein
LPMFANCISMPPIPFGGGSTVTLKPIDEEECDISDPYSVCSQVCTNLMSIFVKSPYKITSHLIIKVEFNSGYIKTHSLPPKVFPFISETIKKKSATEHVSKCQNLQFASS